MSSSGSQGFLGRNTRRCVHNAKSIISGGISVYRSEGITLLVAYDSLDKVLGLHNFYFWTDLWASLFEIARALRSVGQSRTDIYSQ